MTLAPLLTHLHAITTQISSPPLHLSHSFSLQPDSKGEDISFVRQPSEMLIMLQEYMSVLMNIDKHANVEIVRIFTEVFLSQSQLRDSHKVGAICDLASLTVHYDNMKF